VLVDRVTVGESEPDREADVVGDTLEVGVTFDVADAVLDAVCESDGEYVGDTVDDADGVKVTDEYGTQ